MITPRVLDRLEEFDERSRNFPLRALLQEGLPLRSYTWSVPVQLDQGREGACVGFGWSHEAAARPVKVKGITNEVAKRIYKRAQDLDEWDGNAYEGTSVLAGAKAAREEGWAPEFRWTFGLHDLLLGVGYRGPVVVGLPWMTGMMQLDAKGYLRATGVVEGGHCGLINGVDIKRRRAKFYNSWGGACNGFIDFDDLDKLLNMRGEGCVLVKRGLGPKKV